MNLNAKTQIVTVGEFDQRQKQKKVDQEKATRDKAAADKAARDKAAADKAAAAEAARDSAARDRAAAEKAAAVDRTQERTALQKAEIDKAEKPRGIFGSCLRSATAAAIDNDTLVRLKGLSETGLNGQLARVKGFSPRSGRYRVEVKGSVYAIKPEKIEKFEVMEQD